MMKNNITVDVKRQNAMLELEKILR